MHHGSILSLLSPISFHTFIQRLEIYEMKNKGFYNLYENFDQMDLAKIDIVFAILSIFKKIEETDEKFIIANLDKIDSLVENMQDFCIDELELSFGSSIFYGTIAIMGINFESKTRLFNDYWSELKRINTPVNKSTTETLTSSPELNTQPALSSPQPKSQPNSVLTSPQNRSCHFLTPD